eukprot:jgi/Psemu1/58305/gm1.58305_g
MGSNGQDNTALRGFLNELLSEQRTGMNSDDDGLSCGYGSSDSDSVSLSSDEETSYYRKKSKTTKYGGVPHKTKKHKSKISSAMMISSSHHRRLRQHRSRCSQQHSQSHSSQRPSVKFSVPQDNARVGRSRSSPLYHSSHHGTSGNGNGVGMSESSAHSYSLSTSMHSLGSRNSITNTSINNWRSKQQHVHAHAHGHNHHHPRHTSAGPGSRQREPRWSNNLAKTKNYDVGTGTGSGSLLKTRGFADLPDSLHQCRAMVHSAKNRGKHSNTKAGNGNGYGNGYGNGNGNGYGNGNGNGYNKKHVHHNRGPMSSAAAIDSAVALASGISDDDDSSNVEEFYGDEDSVSTSSLLSFATSSSFNSSISSMCWNSRPRQQRAINPFAVPRHETRTAMNPTSTAGGIVPKMPKRTTDQPPVRKILQRSLSDDGSWLSNHSQTSGSHNDFVLRRTKKRGAILRSKSTSDPQVGRWAAMITRDTNPAVHALHQYLAPPRRVPSLSGHGSIQHCDDNDMEGSTSVSGSGESFGGGCEDGNSSGSFLASPSTAGVSQAEPLFYPSSVRSCGSHNHNHSLSMLFAPTRQLSNREMVAGGDRSFREDPAVVDVSCDCDDACSNESRNFGSTHRSQHTAMAL